MMRTLARRLRSIGPARARSLAAERPGASAVDPSAGASCILAIEPLDRSPVIAASLASWQEVIGVANGGSGTISVTTDGGAGYTVGTYVLLTDQTEANYDGSYKCLSNDGPTFKVAATYTNTSSGWSIGEHDDGLVDGDDQYQVVGSIEPSMSWLTTGHDHAGVITTDGLRGPTYWKLLPAITRPAECTIVIVGFMENAADIYALSGETANNSNVVIGKQAVGFTPNDGSGGPVIQWSGDIPQDFVIIATLSEANQHVEGWATGGLTAIGGDASRVFNYFDNPSTWTNLLNNDSGVANRLRALYVHNEVKNQAWIDGVGVWLASKAWTGNVGIA